MMDYFIHKLYFLRSSTRFNQVRLWIETEKKMLTFISQRDMFNLQHCDNMKNGILVACGMAWHGKCDTSSTTFEQLLVKHAFKSACQDSLSFHLSFCAFFVVSVVFLFISFFYAARAQNLIHVSHDFFISNLFGIECAKSKAK